jgi:hypothetical protein
MTPDQKGKLTFPCEFTFKIIGLSSAEFEAQVLVLMRQHFPKLGEGAIKLRPSQNGKYIALSVTVEAQSQEQLDGAYQELTDNPLVLFAL